MSNEYYCGFHIELKDHPIDFDYKEYLSRVDAIIQSAYELRLSQVEESQKEHIIKPVYYLTITKKERFHKGGKYFNTKHLLDVKIDFNFELGDEITNLISIFMELINPLILNAEAPFEWFYSEFYDISCPGVRGSVYGTHWNELNIEERKVSLIEHGTCELEWFEVHVEPEDCAEFFTLDNIDIYKLVDNQEKILANANERNKQRRDEYDRKVASGEIQPTSPGSVLAALRARAKQKQGM
jgi:hypothetical protein